MIEHTRLFLTKHVHDQGFISDNVLKQLPFSSSHLFGFFFTNTKLLRPQLSTLFEQVHNKYCIDGWVSGWGNYDSLQTQPHLFFSHLSDWFGCDSSCAASTGTVEVNKQLQFNKNTLHNVCIYIYIYFAGVSLQAGVSVAGAALSSLPVAVFVIVFVATFVAAP